MLNKLLKYEFKSTARIFLPMYAILLGFALIARFSVAGIEGNLLGGNEFAQTLFVIAIFAYVMVICSTLVVTMVIVVQRFYKNLTGDEGYLMHTLPVSTHELLQAKLITAFVWQLASSVVIVFSVVILLLQPWLIADIREALPYICEGFAEVQAEIGALRLYGNIAMFIITTIISGLTSTLMIYASISIGHTFKSHRILGSVVAYIGLMMLMQMIVGFVGVGTAAFASERFYWVNATAVYVSEQILGIMCMSAIISIGFGCAWYFVSHYVLSSQLNLE